MELIKDILKKDDFFRGKRLLMDFFNGKITSAEFYKEVTYFALICGFDELEPKPYPTIPSDLSAYNNSSEEKRKIIDRDGDFWKQSHINEYIKQCNLVDAWNKGTKDWLKTLLKRLESYGDKPNINKVRQRLDKFPEKMNERNGSWLS